MKRSTLFCLLLATSLLPACRTTRLVSPKPVAPAPTTAATREAIVLALEQNDWLLKAEEPGVIHARRDIGSKHSLTVAITWDEQQVALAYEASRNLKYHRTERGRETIHKNYMIWVKELMRAIKSETARLRKK